MAETSDKFNPVLCEELTGYTYFTGYEIDEDYFKAQEARFKAHTAQLRIFDTVEPVEKQTTFDFS